MINKLEVLFLNSVDIRREEIRAAIVSFIYLFCLMASYYTMRPLRDALASEIPSENLKYLWTATFIFSTLSALVFGYIVSKFKTSSVLSWIYIFFIVNILIFFYYMSAYPLESEDVILLPIFSNIFDLPSPVKISTVIGCVFYVWLSVFNMFVVSVFWSFLADRYTKDQSKRLFGFIAAGGSLGAAIAPIFAASTVNVFGVDKMLIMAAVILSITLICIRDLLNSTQIVDHGHKNNKLGGSSWDGFLVLIKNPYLLLIALFVVLYTFISTIFYVAQVDLVRSAFETREARYAVYAIVDGIVNGLAIFTQIFITTRLARKFGLTFLIAIMPIFMILAFFLLSFFPVLIVILALQVFRRAGNYALTRPGREMLWTVVNRDEKYKAKNVVDTSIYRGADLVNIWIENGLRSAGFNLGQIAIVGSFVALMWSLVAIILGRKAEAKK